MKRILVDMSATILHHGHIRILKKAKEYGYVIVALTTDDEIIKHKNFIPLLNYDQRKEILESIKYVDEVIPSNWIITNSYLKKHSIDFLLHGSDNVNPVSEKKLIIVKRTPNISSTLIRKTNE